MLEFGRLAHMAVFEPWRFEDVVLPYDGEFDRRLRSCKTFIADHPNHTVIGQDKFDALLSMRKAVREHHFRGRTLGEWFDEGESEKAIYFVERVTNVKCRVKVDNLHPEFIFDLKSTVTFDPQLSTDLSTLTITICRRSCTRRASSTLLVRRGHSSSSRLRRKRPTAS